MFKNCFYYFLILLLSYDGNTSVCRCVCVYVFAFVRGCVILLFFSLPLSLPSNAEQNKLVLDKAHQRAKALGLLLFDLSRAYDLS